MFLPRPESTGLAKRRPSYETGCDAWKLLVLGNDIENPHVPVAKSKSIAVLVDQSIIRKLEAQ